MIRAEGEELRPRFKGRLMFPIHDARGRVVGFGGRSIDNTEPKYINSAESAIYSKGQLLYHLHEARHAIRKSERALLVEGYFDVVRTAAAGIDEVVAPLGTALTRDQAKLIRRYSPNVFLMYDSDKAGLKATFRAGDVLLHEGASVRVVTFPDGDDPDTFVAKVGAAGLEKELRAAVDVFDRKLQLLQRGGWFADLTKSRKAIDHLLPTIRAASDHVTRDLYITRAAQTSGVDRETLVREAASAPSALDADDRETPRAAARRAPVRPEGRRRRAPGAQAERALVHAMVIARDRVEEVTEAIGRIDDEASASDPSAASTLRDPNLVAIHRALLDAPDADVAQLTEAMPPEAVPVLEDLLATEASVSDVGVMVDTAVRELKARWRAERQDALTALIRSNPAESDRINAEKARLTDEIVALGVERRWNKF
jgi:DNA primase